MTRGGLLIGTLVAGSWLFLAVSGVAGTEAIALFVIISIQAWGGWAILRPKRFTDSMLGQIGLSLAIGTALSAMAGIAVRAFVDTTWGWIVPALIGTLMFFIHRQRDQRATPHPAPDRGVVVAVVSGLVIGLLGLGISMRSYPLTWTGLWGGYHSDMLFFEAVGSSLADWGPLASIFSPDSVIRYHWLTYAWTGFLNESAGAAPFVSLTRVLPLVTLLSAVLIAATWTRSLTKSTWAPTLAVALIVTGGYAGASYGTILNFDSPSTALTSVWLMAAIWIALRCVERANVSLSQMTLIGLLSAAMTAGKVSAGFLLLSSLFVITAIGLLRKSPWRSTALTILFAGMLGAAAGYLLVVFGSADPGGLDVLSWIDRASSVQGLNPLPGYLGAALGTLILALAVIPRWAGIVWFVWNHETRWTPMVGAALGLAIGGLAPLILVSGGVNETWFALAASAPLAVLSAAGIGRFTDSIKSQSGWKSRMAFAFLAAFLLWVVIWALWNSGPSGGNVWENTWRWAGPIVAIIGSIAIGWLLSIRMGVTHAALGMSLLIMVLIAVPGRLLALGPAGSGNQPGTRGDLFSPTEPFTTAIDSTTLYAWSDTQVQAAQWLRSNSTLNDLIATNITYSPLVPALTGRQTYVSGILYQAPYGWPDQIGTLLMREEESWTFIDDPSLETWEPLCLAGVAYLWIDPNRTEGTSWHEFGDVTFQAPDVVILRIFSERLASCT